MPGDDLTGNHNEFVDDEHGVGDRDHPRGIDGAGEDLGEALDDDALVEGDEHPDEEGAVAERRAGRELLVELRVEVREPFVDVLVQDEAEHGGHGVHGGVAHEQPVAVQRVRLEVRGDAVDGLADADDEAAVHDELGELRRPLVAVAAVPDEELRQVVEGGDAEVGGEGGLAAFLADDADADVGGLDHGDVVAAVADAGDAFLGVCADEGCDIGFLSGGAAAGDNGGELDGEGDEGVAVVGQEVREGGAVDEEGGGGGFGGEETEGVEGGGGVARGGEIGNGVDVLGAGDESGGDGDAAGGFDFVAGEHPDLDASVAEELERGLDVFLEFVFDAGDT